jgi:dipeptidyl aminopeptidase/acylaminoacyl peptidase
MIKNVDLTVDGLKIIGQLYLPQKTDPPYPTVVLCHGIPSGMVDPNDPGYPFLAENHFQQGICSLHI